MNDMIDIYNVSGIPFADCKKYANVFSDKSYCTRLFVVSTYDSLEEAYKNRETDMKAFENKTKETNKKWFYEHYAASYATINLKD